MASDLRQFRSTQTPEGAMMFRDTVNYVLQTMEIGQLDEDGQPAGYEYRHTVPAHSPTEQLCLLVVERTEQWLVKRRSYTLDQELSIAGTMIFYEALLRELKKAPLPRGLADGKLNEVREQATRMLEDAIKQHGRMLKLRAARTPTSR